MLSVEDWAEIRRLRRAEQMPIAEIARVMVNKLLHGPTRGHHKLTVASMISRRVGRRFSDLVCGTGVFLVSIDVTKMGGSARTADLGVVVAEVARPSRGPGSAARGFPRATPENSARRAIHVGAAQAMPGAGLAPCGTGTPRLHGRGRSRRSARVWSMRAPGVDGSWPVLPCRCTAGARPPWPARGGSCLRERLCCTEVATACAMMHGTARRANKVRRRNQGVL